MTSKAEFLSPLDKVDWNFDAVPDTELPACCYWEYARESVFLRELCRRCSEKRQSGGQVDAILAADLWNLSRIGYAVEVFLPGYFHSLEPFTTAQMTGNRALITGHFPHSWQTLSAEQRVFRARIRTSREAHSLVPFRRGPAFFAKWIAEFCETRITGSSLSGKRLKAITGRGSGTSLPGVVPSLFSAGSEIGVFEINWAQFTNDEIVIGFRRWLKANRPGQFAVPDRRGRNKARDWRVALERLGMMRLLHQFRLRDLPKAAPMAWKLYAKRDWYKERKRAGEMFHRLFPFLSRSERPLSWPTKGGHSR